MRDRHECSWKEQNLEAKKLSPEEVVKVVQEFEDKKSLEELWNKKVTLVRELTEKEKKTKERPKGDTQLKGLYKTVVQTLLMGCKLKEDLTKESGEVILESGTILNKEEIKSIPAQYLDSLKVDSDEVMNEIQQLDHLFNNEEKLKEIKKVLCEAITPLHTKTFTFREFLPKAKELQEEFGDIHFYLVECKTCGQALLHGQWGSKKQSESRHNVFYVRNVCGFYYELKGFD